MTKNKTETERHRNGVEKDNERERKNGWKRENK